jgi:hydrogenase-4 component E
MLTAPSVSAALQGVLAVGVLLAEFAMLRSLLVEAIVRVYAVQSFLVAAFAAVVGWRTGNHGLYVLASITFLVKVVAIPLTINGILRRLGTEDRIPAAVPVPRSFLFAVGLGGIAFALVLELRLSVGAGSGLGVGVAILLIGLFMITARPNAVAQLVAFLSLENGIFLASVSLAPELSLIIAVLLVLDVLIPAGAFVLVIRLLAARRQSLHTMELTDLRG